LRPERYFFEIPIYRVSEERFNEGYDRDLLRWLDSIPGLDVHQISEDLRTRMEQHFWETYGGPWRFNQAVGWLRLYVLGSQIRGEIWMSAAKRLQRKGSRRFRHEGKAFEMHCGHTESSRDICSELADELHRFQREHRSGRLHLDLECFEMLSPFIDWHQLVYG